MVVVLPPAERFERALWAFCFVADDAVRGEYGLDQRAGDAANSPGGGTQPTDIATRDAQP
jgi:hypothetical protein